MALQPGQTANPNGRPKKSETWAVLIDRVLRGQYGAQPPAKETNKARVARGLVAKAIAGDIPAISLIMERTEGKLPTKQEQSGSVRIEVVYGDGGGAGGAGQDD